MWIKATQDIILLEEVGLATGSLDTLLLSLGQLEDVAVHRILKSLTLVYSAQLLGGCRSNIRRR